MLKPGDKIVLFKGTKNTRIATVKRLAKLSASIYGGYPFTDRVTLYQYPNPATPEELEEAEAIIEREKAKIKARDEACAARTEDPKYKLAERIIGDGSLERFQRLSMDQLETIESWLNREAE
jgi:hypothetical protein